MGGDDLWAIAMLLAHRERFDIRAIATVFGNVSQPFATRNLLNFLHWLGENSIPVVQGADKPCDDMRPFGDDAYGADGVGGVIFPQSPRDAVTPASIADWYHAQLSAIKAPPVILATGPLTNLALWLEQYPDDAGKIDKIIWMGGGMQPPGGDGNPVRLPNGDIRSGNIMPYAEFNAYQDPRAANIVLQSRARFINLAMDATQYMVLTTARQARLNVLDTTYAPAFHRMLMVVEHLDRAKFGLNGPSIHDPNAVIYLLRPDLYLSRPATDLCYREGEPDNERRGEALLTGSGANATWLCGVTDADAIFDLMLESLAATIKRASDNQARLEG
jgi:inosine-uridine nucleoside N-ribohydrolase